MVSVLWLSPCPKGAQNRGRMAAHPSRKAFPARVVGENGFAGPGGVRGPPRATATAKTACTWVARPTMAKADFSFSLRPFTMTEHHANGSSGRQMWTRHVTLWTH
jgi:hypothetical protein